MNPSAASLAACHSEAAEGFSMLDGEARDQLCRAVRLLDGAELRRHPIELSQALAQVGRCFRAMAAFRQAEDYLQQALRWAGMISPADTAVELLCELAEVACMAAEAADLGENLQAHAARERARDHAFQAATGAGQVSDPQWEVKVLLRISDVLDRCGDHDDAACMQTRALQLMNLAPASAEQVQEALRNTLPQQLM